MSNSDKEQTKADLLVIEKIASRWNVLCMEYGKARIDQLSCVLDIHTAHKACPIDLDALLISDDVNFSHDVGGIQKHVDRITLKLTNGFTPRHSKPDISADAESAGMGH